MRRCAWYILLIIWKTGSVFSAEVQIDHHFHLDLCGTPWLSLDSCGCKSAPIWGLLQHESDYMIMRTDITFLSSRNFQDLDPYFKQGKKLDFNFCPTNKIIHQLN